MSADDHPSDASYAADMPRHGVGLLLLYLTRVFALLGGIILLAVVLMTTASVAGRYLFALPIPGDYEITEFGCGVAILLFFPFCEMTFGNIKAEFFTDRLAERKRAALDLVSEIVFLGVACLLTWRFVVGGLRRMGDGQTSMELGIPLWWGYVPGTFAMILLVLVCIWRGYEATRRIGGTRA